MANYAYIKLYEEIPVESFDGILTYAVKRALGPLWAVKRADFTHDGPTWLVYVPKSAVHDESEARRRWLALGEDVGFPVSVQGDQLAFRHGFNTFARWAQGCVEEELADYYQVGVYFDSTDEVVKPHSRRYRSPTGTSMFREYLLRGMGPESAQRLTERYRLVVPVGHW